MPGRRPRPALRPAERVALSGLLAALAAAGGFALAGVPNVEVVSLLVFLSGHLYGAALGAVVGALGEGLYSGANPLGPPPPPIFAGQVLGMAIAGVAGGIVGALPAPRRGTVRAVIFGAAGVTVTLVFHLLTDAAYALVARLTWAYIVAGIPFYIIHLVTNAGLFAGAGPLVVDAARARLGGNGAATRA